MNECNFDNLLSLLFSILARHWKVLETPHHPTKWPSNPDYFRWFDESPCWNQYWGDVIYSSRLGIKNQNFYDQLQVVSQLGEDNMTESFGYIPEWLNARFPMQKLDMKSKLMNRMSMIPWECFEELNSQNPDQIILKMFRWWNDSLCSLISIIALLMYL